MAGLAGKIRHRFTIQDGRFVLDFPNAFYREAQFFESGYVILFKESEFKKITPGSRAYYFGTVIAAFASHHYFYGMSRTDIHHQLMDMFCGFLYDKNGKAEKCIPSINSLSQKDFSEYLEKVEYFAGSIGVDYQR